MTDLNKNTLSQPSETGSKPADEATSEIQQSELKKPIVKAINICCVRPRLNGSHKINRK